MLPDADLHVRILDLNRHVDEVNRTGWLRQSARRDRPSIQFRALLGTLVTLVRRNRSVRTVGESVTESATSLVAACQ